jgi:hypothetical protein
MAATTIYNSANNKFGFAYLGLKSSSLVMEAWLKQKGVARLANLVTASGVKKTHDYAGVGSSPTRNMKKAGGPKKWYDEHRDVNGERVYTITPELVGPLRHAFRV